MLYIYIIFLVGYVYKSFPVLIFLSLVSYLDFILLDLSRSLGKSLVKTAFEFFLSLSDQIQSIKSKNVRVSNFACRTLKFFIR